MNIEFNFFIILAYLLAGSNCIHHYNKKLVNNKDKINYKILNMKKGGGFSANKDGN
jgi:hypothetical protein